MSRHPALDKFGRLRYRGPIEPISRAVRRAQREWLCKSMEAAGYNVTMLARISGMNRTWIYRLIARLTPDMRLRPIPEGERKRMVPRIHRATGGNAAWRALEDGEPRARA